MVRGLKRTSLSVTRGRPRRDGERGQVLVLFSLVVVLLMVLASLVIDVGLFRTDGARLQNALDSAALAATSSLPATTSTHAAATATAVSYTQRNFPGIDTPGTRFLCIIGVDANGLPRVSDMPMTCNVSYGATSASWRCTGEVCWAPCDPATVATDVCNTIEVSDSATRSYTFGRAVGVNERSTGTLTAAACVGPCGAPPVAPVDVALVIDRTLSMQGDEANLRNAAFAVLQAYDPDVQHVALGMLGPSSATRTCANGAYGEPLVFTVTAPTYQASASGSNSSSGATSLAVAKPSGTAVGEVLVAGITFDAGTSVTTVTAPAGWVLIRRTNNGTNVGQAAYYKVVTAADATITSYTWGFGTTARRASGGIVRYSGVDTSDPVNISGGATGTSTTVQAPSVTTTTAQTALVGFFSTDTGTTFNTVSGMTERFDARNSSFSGPSGAADTGTLSNAGASGSKSATAMASAPWAAQLIALRPIPAEYDIRYPVTPYPSGLARWIPVGLTGTSDAPVIDSYLNADGSLNTASDLVRTINCVQPGHLFTGTDLATPIEFAWQYLRDHARPNVKTGIIFETDGTPQTQNYTCAQATAAANAAKAAGIEVFTIGFGVAGQVCPDNTGRSTITQLASMATNSSSTSTTQCDANENVDGDHFFCQPAGSDLSEVFRAAAVQLIGGSRLVQLYPQPIVSSISPSTGAKTGGTTVMLTGMYFSEAYSVTFGGTPADSFTVLSDNSIRAVAPAGTPNTTVDIRVSTPGGSSKAVTADRFTYQP